MRRTLFSAVIALGVALPVGAAVTAGPAGAAKAKTITCTKMTGSINLSTDAGKFQFKGCNGNTGTKSKKISTATITSGGVLKWTNGKTTSISAPTLGSGALCPAGTVEDVTASGTVTADTTHSATVGGPYTSEVCIAASGALSLAPGTKATFS